MSDHLALRLIGKSGRVWNISGPQGGDEGAELMPKPKNFYASPVITYWIKSGGAARALEPKPEKRPRKIAARKPPEQRIKIRSRAAFPQGRKLQGRGFEKRPT